jgi:16S rRNA (guanine527-N7)-methyltransferase
MALSIQDKDRITLFADTNNFKINAASLSKIEKYFDILIEWSAKFNLVSHKDRELLIENHILDSLGPLNLIPDICRIIDIGSGAGFPGIPLAIMRPNSYMTLLESIHKRSQFLRAAIEHIGLTNTIIVEKRLEILSSSSNYDIATVRALPKRDLMMPYIHNILSPNGKILFFAKRGQYEIVEKTPS